MVITPLSIGEGLGVRLLDNAKKLKILLFFFVIVLTFHYLCNHGYKQQHFGCNQYV